MKAPCLYIYHVDHTSSLGSYVRYLNPNIFTYNTAISFKHLQSYNERYKVKGVHTSFEREIIGYYVPLKSVSNISSSHEMTGGTFIPRQILQKANKHGSASNVFLHLHIL